MSRLQEEKAAGFAAAKAGKDCDACPHTNNIRERSAWLVGWQNGGGNIHTGKAYQCSTCRDTKSVRVAVQCPQCCPPAPLPPAVLAVMRAALKVANTSPVSDDFKIAVEEEDFVELRHACWELPPEYRAQIEDQS